MRTNNNDPLNSGSVPTDNTLEHPIDVTVHTSAQTFMDDKRAVGVSIGIFNDGKTFTYNYGEVEKGSRTLPSHRTLYEIASITKTFTGTLLAHAVVEQHVQLDDDVRIYLDDEYPNLAFDGQPVKLVHLINHTSQLPFMLPDRPELFEHPDPIELPKMLVHLSQRYTRTNFFADLHQVQLDTVPGVAFKYSNAAAQLLGYILERVYGMSYEQVVTAKITGPLHMQDTKISLSHAERGRLATGHYEDGSAALYDTPHSQAAGALYSSTSDMLEYVAFHLNETHEVVRLSHQPTWGDIHTSAVGLNWQLQMTAAGQRRIWQSGGSFGFSSYCVVVPDVQLGVVLLANEADRTTQGRLASMANTIQGAINEQQ